MQSVRVTDRSRVAGVLGLLATAALALWHWSDGPQPAVMLASAFGFFALVGSHLEFGLKVEAPIVHIPNFTRNGRHEGDSHLPLRRR